MLRQVSKKKLLKWMEANQEKYPLTNDTNIFYDVINTNKLLQALESGELDMVKDYRIHGEVK
jgi:hypothetical protein